MESKVQMKKPDDHRNIVSDKENLRTNSSKTLLKFVENILSVKDRPVLDVPCGFGRHSFLFATLGCEVICVDIDEKALDYIYEFQKGSNFAKALTILKEDLGNDRWRFEKESIGAVVNVHYYKESLLDLFISSLVLGGFLYLETPGGHGGNYVDLPGKDFVRSKLAPYFNFLFYQENKTGPAGLGHVAVKVFAQKIKLFNKK